MLTILIAAAVAVSCWATVLAHVLFVPRFTRADTACALVFLIAGFAAATVALLLALDSSGPPRPTSAC